MRKWRQSQASPVTLATWGEARDTREGWPLLTVETEARWGLKVYKWKGSFCGWFVELVVLVQEDICSALAALVSPVQNIFFLTVHYVQFVCPPSPSKLGWQSCRVACYLVYVSGEALDLPVLASSCMVEVWWPKPLPARGSNVNLCSFFLFILLYYLYILY